MQNTSTAFVEFSQVGKSYDGHFKAVENFNLRVAAGEFVTLLGPSGCGKTTCLKMLAGFEHPSEGEIFLKGQPVANIAAHKRNIGVVFQNYALFPHMTVGSNLAFPLQARGLSRSEVEAQVKRALGMVQLQEFADRYPSQMSGGQQQRAAIARSLVFEPDMVLMDEPLGALDRRLREEMQYEIRRLQQRLEVTMVYVTHDQGEAMAMSDRVAVMSGGQIQQIATPEELYEEPERTFVANFIGENNLLDGMVVELDHGSDICQVEISDGVGGTARVGAFPVAVDGTGQPTCLAIRPERIAVNPDPSAYPNLFDARVDDMIFMGDHLRLHVALFDKLQMVVKIQNIVGHGAVLPGDRVKLGWLLTDCRALDPVQSSVKNFH